MEIYRKYYFVIVISFVEEIIVFLFNIKCIKNMSINLILKNIKNHFGDRKIKVAELGVLHGHGITLLLNNLNIEEYHGIDLILIMKEMKKIMLMN